MLEQKFRVIKGEGDYTSKTLATVDLKKGDVIGSFKETATKTTKVRYTSVQVGKDEHIELNSDLVYLNHSCAPNVRMDVTQMKAIAERDIKAGEELTFFYPSTEWSMAQPFTCWCGAKNCLKQVQGAKYLSKSQLEEHGFINKHIIELVNESHK